MRGKRETKKGSLRPSGGARQPCFPLGFSSACERRRPPHARPRLLLSTALLALCRWGVSGRGELLRFWRFVCSNSPDFVSMTGQLRRWPNTRTPNSLTRSISTYVCTKNVIAMLSKPYRSTFCSVGWTRVLELRPFVKATSLQSGPLVQGVLRLYLLGGRSILDTRVSAETSEIASPPALPLARKQNKRDTATGAILQPNNLSRLVRGPTPLQKKKVYRHRNEGYTSA